MKDTKRMRVLLVQHSIENVEAYPLGLGYVAAVLREEGHAVDFLDLALARGDRAGALLQRAQAHRAQAIGFTVITPQYDECRTLVQKVKPELQDTRFIMGGPHPSALPEEVLREGVADVVVVSEGEETGPELFKTLEEGGDLKAVPGIAFLDDEGQYVLTALRGKVMDLDSLPYPPWDILHPEKYHGRIRGRKRANVLTSRGCPYRCIFCARGPSSGLPYRKRSIENVLEEIRRLYRNYGIGGFGFRDDIFTLDMDYTRELCDALCAEKLRIYWMCQTRVDKVDGDLLRKIKKAGCVTVEFGVESGSDTIREKLRKKVSKEQIRRAFRYCHELGIPTMAYFMIGTPWETPETVEETISFAKELRSTMTLFFLAIPYPGSELREEFLKAGWNFPQDYGGFSNFIEGKSFRTPGQDNDEKYPGGFHAAACRRATREIALAQIRDVWHYPELLCFYLRRHSLREFVTKAAQRLRRTL